MFPNNIWSLFKIFQTAFIKAVQKSNVDIVKLIFEQGGVNINEKDVYLLYSEFFLII